MKKADPIRVPDSGSQMGPYSGPLQESMVNGKSRSPFWVRNLAPKTGPPFYARIAKKWNPGFPETANAGDENGHCHAMVRFAIPPHEPTDLDQVLGYNATTA